MTLTKIEAKVWFLASGTKKVGPMTRARLRDRIAESRTPARLRAWREGMDAWLPIAEIPELDAAGAEPTAAAAAAQDVDAGEIKAEVASDPRPESRSGSKAESGSRSGTRRALVSRTRSAPRAEAAPSGTPFAARYRIDRGELWRAFSIGFEAPRLKLAVLLLGAWLALQAVVLVALLLSPILGAIAGLGAVPAGLVVAAVGLGALGYQTRRRLETGTTPGPIEALTFAKDHAVALTLAPVVLSIVALAPPILLAIKSLVGWIPAIGEPAAGLTFGLDLALSAATLFFGLAAALGWSLSSSIVAFEETGVVGTVQAILALVKNAFPRFVLWSILPRLAVSALGGVLFVLALFVAAPPIVLNLKVVAPVLGVAKMAQGLIPSGGVGRSPARDDGFKSGNDGVKSGNDGFKSSDAKATSRAAKTPAASATPAPSLETPAAPEAGFDLTLGLFGVVLWVLALWGVVMATLVSTQTALNGMLYLACRPGNDELVTRDQWLAQQQQS